MQHLSWQHLSISAIPQQLLTRFWSNFKVCFLGTSLTDVITRSVQTIQDNCHTDICPCNICPGDICPYQQYLRCYWPDFDQNLKVYSWDLFEHNPTVTMTFVQATLVLATFVHIVNISDVNDPILTKLYLKVGSWDNLEHIPTVTVTFVKIL